MKINISNKTTKLFIYIFTCFLFCTTIIYFLHRNIYKSEVKQITMGTSADFLPFEYLSQNEIVGIDVEIAKKIAQKQNCELKIKDMSFNSVLTEVINGSVDMGISGITKTEERAKKVDFSDSYFTASQKAMVKNNSDIKSVKDIKDKKIGVQLGTTGDNYCTDNKLGEITRYDKYTDAVSALSNEIIDVLVLDGFTADQIAKKNKDFLVIPENITEESYCIAVKKGRTDLIESINKVISEIKQNGELDQIVEKYMNSSKSDSSEKFDSKFTNKEYFEYISKGLIVTLRITLFSMIVGIILGILAASLRIISNLNKKLKILGVLVNFYTTVIRGTPVIVQLFIIYYIALSGISKNPIIAAVITLGVNSGAYVCEHIRAGIQAISKGQFEAGKSLGLSEKTLMSKIIIPQAVKNTLPSLAGEAISLLKETAAVGFIGVMDLSLAGKKITSVTFDPVIPLFTVAAIYLVLVVGLTFILNKIERKIKNANN